jgi:hypothetical protein
MQASILLTQSRPSAARGALDAALAGSFAVKAWPQFHVLLGQVLLLQADVRFLTRDWLQHCCQSLHAVRDAVPLGRARGIDCGLQKTAAIAANRQPKVAHVTAHKRSHHRNCCRSTSLVWQPQSRFSVCLETATQWCEHIQKVENVV